jgi:hypothetical protein
VKFIFQQHISIYIPASQNIETASMSVSFQGMPSTYLVLISISAAQKHIEK